MTTVLTYFTDMLSFSSFRVQTVATALNATECVVSTPDRTRTHALFFFSLSVSHFTHAHCGSRYFRLKSVRVIILWSLPYRSLMSFRKTPRSSFPQVWPSPTCSGSRLSASTTSMERSFWEQPCEPALCEGVRLVKGGHTLFGRNAQVDCELQMGEEVEGVRQGSTWGKRWRKMERSMSRENRTHHERMWMTTKRRTQLGLEPCGALCNVTKLWQTKCEGGVDVIGFVTSLGRVAQAFHGDGVVELRVQLEVQEVKGKKKTRKDRWK